MPKIKKKPDVTGFLLIKQLFAFYFKKLIQMIEHNDLRAISITQVILVKIRRFYLKTSKMIK